MTDYNELSDFEINKRVAIALGYDCPSTKAYPHTGGNGVYRHRKGNAMRDCRDVDYCNNPGDTWPIILEHEICLHTNEHPSAFLLKGYWEAGDRVECKDKNPLRAACIVYLMLKESESE